MGEEGGEAGFIITLPEVEGRRSALYHRRTQDSLCPCELCFLGLVISPARISLIPLSFLQKLSCTSFNFTCSVFLPLPAI